MINIDCSFEREIYENWLRQLGDAAFMSENGVSSGEGEHTSAGAGQSVFSALDQPLLTRDHETHTIAVNFAPEVCRHGV